MINEFLFYYTKFYNLLNFLNQNFVNSEKTDTF